MREATGLAPRRRYGLWRAVGRPPTLRRSSGRERQRKGRRCLEDFSVARGDTGLEEEDGRSHGGSPCAPRGVVTLGCFLSDLNGSTGRAALDWVGSPEEQYGLVRCSPDLGQASEGLGLPNSEEFPPLEAGVGRCIVWPLGWRKVGRCWSAHWPCRFRRWRRGVRHHSGCGKTKLVS